MNCQEEYLLKSLSEPSCLQRISVNISSGHEKIRWKRGVSSTSFPRETKIMPLVRNMEMDPYCPRHITLLVICEKRKRCASKLKPADTLRTAWHWPTASKRDAPSGPEKSHKKSRHVPKPPNTSKNPTKWEFYKFRFLWLNWWTFCCRPSNHGI